MLDDQAVAWIEKECFSALTAPSVISLWGSLGSICYCWLCIANVIFPRVRKSHNLLKARLFRGKGEHGMLGKWMAAGISLGKLFIVPIFHFLHQIYSNFFRFLRMRFFFHLDFILNMVLLVHRRAIEFCAAILYPATLLNIFKDFYWTKSYHVQIMMLWFLPLLLVPPVL